MISATRRLRMTVERSVRMSRHHHRRGMLLVVVLAIIGVLALLGASFSYWMGADLATVSAAFDRQQAKLATDAGLNRTILLLRKDTTDASKPDPINMDTWYNNPLAFRRILVWAPDQIGGSESLADQEKIEGRSAWRFSIVSYDIVGQTQKPKIRYGLTPENGKLNLNTATREQLMILFRKVLAESSGGVSERVTPEQLADSLTDWIDKDDDPISSNGAESGYYMTLDPPYRSKNRPLETTEELLSIKWFNGRILYGEDYNRNGYLDENEDDGPDGLFPPDNADGVLDRGLLPFVTVYSWEQNWANDNKARLNINQLSLAKPERLPSYFSTVLNEIDPETIEFIAQAQKRGHKFESVGELVGLQVFEDGSTNYDDIWKEYKQARKQANRVQKIDQEESQTGENSEDQGPGPTGKEAGGSDLNSSEDMKIDQEELDREIEELSKTGLDEALRTGGNRDNRGSRDGERTADKNYNNSGEDEESQENGARGKDSRRRQSIRNENNRPGRRSPRGGDVNAGNGEEENRDGRADSGDRRGGRDRGGNRRNDDRGLDSGGDRSDRVGRDGAEAGDRGDGRGRGRDMGGRDGRNDTEGRDQEGRDPNRGVGRRRGGRDDGGDRSSGGDGVSSRPSDGSGGSSGRKPKGQPIVSPVTVEKMPVLVDRLTVKNMLERREGLINVNTAPAEVLATLSALTEEEIQAIITRRMQLSGEEKRTIAWLVTAGVLSPEKFMLISNDITARTIQYAADVIGFADHTGTSRRIQAIIEMQGHFAQIKYYRDISALGIGFPVWDDQRSEGFAFDAP